MQVFNTFCTALAELGSICWKIALNRQYQYHILFVLGNDIKYLIKVKLKYFEELGKIKYLSFIYFVKLLTFFYKQTFKILISLHELKDAQITK